MATERSAQEALDVYVGSLVAIGGQLTSILSFMYERADPDASPSPNEVLTDLLGSILEEPAAACRDADLLAAAEIVELTAKTIAEELFLVSDELMEEWKREARRARRQLPMRPRRPI
jgi:hypothetical protein